MIERIPVAGPWITDKEVAYVADAAANAWYARANIYHERFEKQFAEYLDVRYAVALPSCTSAIHLSLLSLGVGPGDEVIVPDLTWIASSAPINYVGASPVFADVDEQTWCLTPDSLRACLTPRTKAIIAVDLYGGMPDWDALRQIASEQRAFIIEDAAEAVGSEYKGRKAGAFGRTGVFSFHGSKTLTTGEGGLLATDDESVYRRVLFLRDHGRSPGDRMFCNTEVAYKYKMSSLQAALGLAQLERIEELVAKKRRIFDWYRQGLKDCHGVRLNSEPEGTRNSYWMVTALVDPRFGLTKEKLMYLLERDNIDSRPFFHPLSSIPAYAALPEAARARERNRTSYRIHPYGINLPSGFNLEEETVRYVCERLKAILSAQPI